ncbi:DMT family transporter [Rhodopirellula sp. JC639]|uniref:DMT family transporter n=1 Tax=Stieleria mannarensis TaxID=2755585 RepID=UPI0015FF8353|nr:DMT family transporter [Rhodopirellula sp. JC639]
MNHSTTFFLIAICVGLLAGGLLGTQPSINGSLGKSVAHPLQASLISFGSGTAILLVLTLALGGFPPQFVVSPRSLPWWIWFGGAIGVVMVSTSLLIVPRIGSLPWFAAVMTGQTVAALLLDHYGLLGNPRTPVSALRVGGTLLLVLGILAIVGARRLESTQDTAVEVLETKQEHQEE